MGYWERFLKEGRPIVAGEASQNRQLYQVFLKIVEHIRTFKAIGDYSQGAYRTWTLSKYLSERGYNINFNNCTELGEGYASLNFAGVNPPRIDKNNPLIVNFKRHMYQGNADLETFGRYVRENQLIGIVGPDLTLGGDISKIPVTVYISPPMFTLLSAEELAAVILHELGHVYFYFRYMVRTLVSSGVADFAARQFLEIEDKTLRLKVLTDIEKVTGGKIKDKEQLVEEYKKEVVYTHVVNDLLLERENIVGGEAMANRTWERLADYYVSLHGASDYLATGLYKQETSMGWAFTNRAYDSWGSWYLLEAVRMTTLTGISVVFPGFGGLVLTGAALAMGLYLNDTNDSLYDDPKERYQTMRRALIARLKDIEGGSGPEVADMRQRCLEGISVLDGVLEKVNDRDTFYTYIIKRWTENGRRNAEAVSYQHDLESYIDNDLSVITSKLKGKL